MKRFLLLALVPALVCAAEPQSESDIFGAVHANAIDLLNSFIAADPAVAQSVLAKSGMTPLHYAAKLDRLEAASILLKAGADPNAAAKNLTTPLHWAADANSADVLRLLLANGAVADARAKNGLTPLHLAARNEAVECIVRLVEAGVDPNVADDAGNTPLHEAAAKNRPAAVAALVARGADSGRANKKGEKPADLARADAVRAALAGSPASAAAPAPVRAEPGFPTATAPSVTALSAFADPARPASDGYAEFAADPGTVRIPDGTLYNGGWNHGRFEGVGVHVFRPDGERFEGMFHRGRRHGRGVYRYANGDVLECDWEDDVPDGDGSFTFATGGTIRGTWRRGLFLRGEGTFSTGSGSQSYGHWEDGHLVSSQPVAR